MKKAKCLLYNNYYHCHGSDLSWSLYIINEKHYVYFHFFEILLLTGSFKKNAMIAKLAIVMISSSLTNINVWLVKNEKKIKKGKYTGTL